MAGKSWEFAGETKDWDNFWEHKFIRTQLVTGWSAQEGGPGASSHQREERTQTYLRRPCGIRARGLQTLCALRASCSCCRWLGQTSRRVVSCMSFASGVTSCVLGSHEPIGRPPRRPSNRYPCRDRGALAGVGRCACLTPACCAPGLFFAFFPVFHVALDRRSDAKNSTDGKALLKSTRASKSLSAQPTLSLRLVCASPPRTVLVL